LRSILGHDSKNSCIKLLKNRTLTDKRNRMEKGFIFDG